jgi:hypothetical protein
MCIGCPQPNMVLRLISSLSDSWSSRVKTIDKCFLFPMLSDLQSHLGCSFNLMFANHGLLAYSVLRMCIIRCGEGFLSQVEIPVSTPSITIHGQGLSSFISFIGMGYLVRKWEIDMACGLRSVAECPSHVRMQFPAKLHVTPAMCMSSLFSASELLTFVNILALLLHSLIGGGDLNIIVNLLGWWRARGFWGFSCFLGCYVWCVADVCSVEE